jgi:hypothetical protein
MSLNIPSTTFWLIAIMLVLGACGGDSGGANDGSTSSTPNRPPIINAAGDLGTASGPEVLIEPDVTDADGDALAFTWTLVRGPDINGKGVFYPLDWISASDTSGSTIMPFPANGDY